MDRGRYEKRLENRLPRRKIETVILVLMNGTVPVNVVPERPGLAGAFYNFLNFVIDGKVRIP
jgi:hypothetical protein